MDFYDSNQGNQSMGDASWDQVEHQPQKLGKGPWHVVLSLVCLGLGILGAVLMAVLFANIDKRNWWQLGLVFFVPAALVTFGAYIVEDQTNAMTPRFSRNAQLLVALVAAVLAFGVGAAGIPREEPVVTITTQGNYLILMDLSSSMGYEQHPDRYPDSVRAIQDIYDSLDEGTYFGFIQYNHEIIDQIPLAPKNSAQASLLKTLLQNKPHGGTTFDEPINQALKLVELAKLSTDQEISIIMVTDADDSADIHLDNTNYFIKKAKSVNARVSFLQLESTKPHELDRLVRETGGQSVLVSQSSQLVTDMTKMITSQVEVYYDILRDDDPSTLVVSAILLVGLGLMLGVSLSLMLSHQRQLRLQLLISPLMGILAFVVIKLQPGPLRELEAPLREAIGFSFYGLVLMCKNQMGRRTLATASRPSANSVAESDFFGVN